MTQKIVKTDYKIAERIYAKRLYIFAFFIPVILLYVSYCIFGIWPFGKLSVLALDLNGQYVYYFEHLRDVFWGKSGNFFNSWSRNFSGETVGMFAYYLASPFTLIPTLLPRSMMTESLMIMQLCKVGTAGIAFSYYLKNSRKLTDNTALMFSILYSLMGYMIVELMNPMWLDGLFWLPVIVFGIEKIIEQGRIVPFVIPLALMFIAHFYIGWMIAIFCVLYFFGYYFLISEFGRHFKIKEFLFAGLKFGGGGLLAAVCSAWLLIPLYHALKLGKFEFSDPDFKLKTQFLFGDFFQNLLPNVYDTVRPEGSPVIFCGIITLLLVPLFFLNDNIKATAKLGYALLSALIILSMYMSTVDLVWHGFQVPNWLPYRYSFILCFLLLVMAATAFDNIDGVEYKDIGAAFFALAAYVFYIDSKGLENVTLIATVWFTVTFAAVYAIFLYLHKKKCMLKVAMPLTIAIFIMLESVISTTYTLTRINKDITYSTHDSYNRYITLGRDTTQKLYSLDPIGSNVYRVEKDFDRTVNDPMAFGTYGVSHSSSTLNSAPIEFLRNMGFSYGGHYIKYRGATYVTDSLFGIKYVMEKGAKAKQPDPDTVYEDVYGNILPPPEPEPDEIAYSKHYADLVLANGDNKEIMYVYENPYALPIGFMADYAVLDAYTSSDNPFVNQNNLLSAMLSDTYVPFFKQILLDDIRTENAKETLYGNHKKYAPKVEGENSQVEFFITAPSDNMLYFYFPSSYEREVNLWYDHEFSDTWDIKNNHQFLGKYFERGQQSIMTLGRFEPNEQIQLITTITDKNEVFFKDQYFYELDDELFRNAISQLREQSLNVTYFKENHIKGSVTAQKDGILFTTIAYEPGWTIKVDGQKVEPVPLLETGTRMNHSELIPAFIGVDLSAGTHEIEFSFFPYGMFEGIVLSLVGIVTLLCIWLYERRQSKVVIY